MAQYPIDEKGDEVEGIPSLPPAPQMSSYGGRVEERAGRHGRQIFPFSELRSALCSQGCLEVQLGEGGGVSDSWMNQLLGLARQGLPSPPHGFRLPLSPSHTPPHVASEGVAEKAPAQAVILNILVIGLNIGGTALLC